MKSEPWTQQKFSYADLFNCLQTFLVQALAVFVMSIPVIHNRHLHQTWIFTFAAISLISSILSLALYPALGLSWSNLLAYFSAISQSLFALQLTKGLQSSIVKALKGA
jgi:hypothetical protein